VADRARRSRRASDVGKSPSPGDDFTDDDWLDRYGGGEYDPDTGLYEWYSIPESVQAAERQAAGVDPSLRWGDILTHWSAIENDLQDRRIDLDDPAIRARTGRWLRTRIVGLLTAPPIQTEHGTAPANRLQHAIDTERRG
jgi:hypothetical protein